MSEVLLYIGNINNYDFSKAVVSSQRKETTERMRFEDDRRKSILAEQLLRKALLAEGLISDVSEDLKYGFSAHEKPYLINYPALHFNFSHSGDFALCAVSDEEVGADLERIKDIDLKLAKRFFSPSEYDRLLAQNDPCIQRELFFSYWTMKESYIKFTGEGLPRMLGGFDACDPSLGVSFREVSDIPGYKLTICTKTQISELSVVQIC